MPRRFTYSRRRMALESLEVRCNPSAMDPGTSIIIEPTTEAAGELAEIGEIAPDQGRADGGRTNVEVFVTVTDTETSMDAPDKRGVAEVSLNSFAGQTVRLRIAAVNNQGKLVVGIDDAGLSGGIRQDDFDSRSSDDDNHGTHVGVNDRRGWE